MIYLEYRDLPASYIDITSLRISLVRVSEASAVTTIWSARANCKYIVRV